MAEVKIAGIMMGKNQGHRLKSNILYHLNVAGFDRMVYIDNDSFDDSVEIVASMNDARVKLICTGQVAFKAQEIPEYQQAIKDLVHNDGIDYIFNIDCDMLWVSKNGTRVIDIMKSLPPACYEVYGYYYAPHKSLLEQLEQDEEKKKDYHECWWKHIKHRFNTMGVQKVILHKQLVIDGGDFAQGCHYAIDKNKVRIEGLKRVDDLLVCECAMLDYDDFVRKVLNISMGRVSSIGYKWLRQEKGVSGAHRVWVKQLMTKGHLRDVFEEFTCNDQKSLEGTSFEKDTSLL